MFGFCPKFVSVPPPSFQGLRCSTCSSARATTAVPSHRPSWRTLPSLMHTAGHTLVYIQYSNWDIFSSESAILPNTTFPRYLMLLYRDAATERKRRGMLILRVGCFRLICIATANRTPRRRCKPRSPSACWTEHRPKLPAKFDYTIWPEIRGVRQPKGFLQERHLSSTFCPRARHAPHWICHLCRQA